MKHAIIGSGAIGIFYGSLLVRAGEEVHFLSHSDYSYVQQNGFQIDSSPLGNYSLKKVNVYNNTHEMPVCDYAFICLKTTENKRLLPQLLPSILNDQTIIVLIQNGLGVEDDVAHMFPNNQIIGASAFVSINKVSPGHIVHLDHGDIQFGSYNVQDFKSIEFLVEKLISQKINSIATKNLTTLRWRKLVWNITFNGMSVIMNCKTDKLMQDQYMIELCMQIIEEIILGATACGVELDKSLA